MKSIPIALLVATLLALFTSTSHASNVTVHGQVHEFASASPLAGANVSIQYQTFMSYTEVGSTTTAADGSYAWAGDCPISFTPMCRVYVSAADHVDAEQYFDVVATPDASLDFSLHRFAKIAGVVRTAGSQPLAQALVRVDCVPIDLACFYNRAAYTSADGSYSVDSIPGGTYRVCFVPAENDALMAQCHDYVDADASAQDPLYSPVIVADAQTRNGIDFDVHGGGSISGNVTDSYFHHPVANESFNVQIFDTTGALLSTRSMVGDVDGHYDVRGLAAGAYYVSMTIVGAPYQGTIVYPNLHCTGDCDPTLGQAVTVSGTGTVSGVDFEFDPTAVATGRVTHAQNGNGLAGIPVRYAYCLAFGCPIREPVVTDAAGNFTLFVPTGVPVLIYTSNLHPWIDQAYPGVPCIDGGCTFAGSELTFSMGEHRGNVDFSLELGAFISGRIIDAHPNGTLAATVFDGAMQAVVTTYADSEGHYATPAWIEGHYYILAQSDNACLWYDAVECTDGDYNPPAKPTRIALQAGEARTGIDFLFDSSDRIFRDGF